MFLRFKSGNHVDDYELFGAQDESLIGVVDALRSAILDLTADVITLGGSIEAATATLNAVGDVKALAQLSLQVSKAQDYCAKHVDVYLYLDKTDNVLLQSWPHGLKAVGGILATATVLTGREILAGIGTRTRESLLRFVDGFTTDGANATGSGGILAGITGGAPIVKTDAAGGCLSLVPPVDTTPVPMPTDAVSDDDLAALDAASTAADDTARALAMPAPKAASKRKAGHRRAAER